MNIDFSSLAFNSFVDGSSGTPNWAKSLGQGDGYKINSGDKPGYEGIDDLLKGMVYNAVPLSSVVGTFGRASAKETDSCDKISKSCIVLQASVFHKVYINDDLVGGGKFILLITRDSAASHTGRLKLKFAANYKYIAPDGREYSNEGFFNLVRDQYELADNACFFVWEIIVRDQDELVLKTCFVNNEGPATYASAADRKADWEKRIRPYIQRNRLPSLGKRMRTKHPLNCVLYGAPGTGKTYATAEYALSILDNTDVAAVGRQPRAVLMQRYNEMVDSGRIVFTTFHQSYGYEDFIQGIRPDTHSAEVRFRVVNGIFKEIAERAMASPDKDFVIIIDEINRANISKVFGELITLIEDDKRWGEENGMSVTLPSGDIFAVPNNLYILGTMNSADKSISLLDVALRRRFEFVEFIPRPTLITDSSLSKVLETINAELKDQLGGSDLLIGHSFFMGKSIGDLASIMNKKIVPLLYEYFMDDRRKVASLLEQVLKGTPFTHEEPAAGRIRVSEKAPSDNGKDA